MKKLLCKLFHGRFREAYVESYVLSVRDPWSIHAREVVNETLIVHCFKCKSPPFWPSRTYRAVTEIETAERQRRIREVA